MVVKKKSTSEQGELKGKVKVGKLKLNRETVKDLTSEQQKRVKGGLLGNASTSCSVNFKCCKDSGNNC